MNNEKKQAELLDRYFDMLLQNPLAKPPHDLDAETAELARQLAGIEQSSLPLTEPEKSRIWQNTTANQVSNHLNTERRHNLMFNPNSLTRPQPIHLPNRRFSWLVAAAIISMLILGGLFFSAVQLNNNGIGVEPNNANSGNFGGETVTSSPADISTWDGERRVNILIMGVDNRPGEPWNCRTDTVMLLSIDLATKRMDLLSIPRDTYVEVPDHGLHRLNSVCVLGHLENPNKGPLLTMHTIQYNFGIPVNEYLIVDFAAFMRLIDEIGGIEINVETAIDDPQYPDMYYGYEPFYLEAGFQHLDGATALKYVRSRHGSDDFVRQERQQAVLAAMRQRVLATGALDDLILRMPFIWGDLDDQIETSFSLEEFIQLAMLVWDIEDKSINGHVLDISYFEPYTSEEGISVLVPNYDQVTEHLTEIFGQVNLDYDDPLQVRSNTTPTFTPSVTATVTPTVDSQSVMEADMTNTAAAITPTFTPSVTATVTATPDFTSTIDTAHTSTAASDMTATFEEQLEVMGLDYGESVNLTYPLAIENQFYEFAGQQGDIISMTTTGELDTILVLSQSNGVVVASDDDSGPALNAELYHIQLPVNDTYRIRLQVRDNPNMTNRRFELSLTQVRPLLLAENVELPIILAHNQTSQILSFDGKAGETISLSFQMYSTSSPVHVQVMQDGTDLGTLDFLPELYESTLANEQGAAPSMSRSIFIPDDGEVLIYVSFGSAPTSFVDGQGNPQDDVINLGAIVIRN